MAGLADLSDEELLALRRQSNNDLRPPWAAQKEQSAPVGDLSSLSDEELLALRGKPAQGATAGPPEAPVTAGGLYKAVDAGAAQAAAGIAGLPRAVSDLGAKGIQAATNWTADQFGRPDWKDTRDLSKPGLIKLPTSGEAADAIQRDLYGGAAPYEPQNRLERYGKTIGEYLPNAITPGGLLTKAATVAVPALASEAVKEQGGGELAQAATGLAAGLGVTKTASTLAARAAKAANPTPAIEKLFDLGDKTFNQAKALGVELNPTAVSKAAGSIRNDLIQKFGDEDLLATKILARFGAEHSPNAANPMAALTGVQAAAKAPVTADAIKTVREQLGHVAYNAEKPAQRYAARLAQEGIDDFLGSVPTKDIISGDPAKVAELFKKGRDYWSAGRRAEMVAGRVELGDLNAATAGSGRNVDNATRQAVKSLIRPDMKGKTAAQKSGFSDAEIEQMNRVARGGFVDNQLRHVGNLLGGGGGLLQAGIGGAGALASYHTGNPEWLLPALVGVGAKKLSGAMTKRQVNRLDEMVRSRAPGYVYTAPPTQLNNSLLLGGLQLPRLLDDQ